MLRETKKKKEKKNAKIWNFTILSTTLVQTHPRSILDFGELIWCVLSEETSFEIFTPIWSHVNEKEINRKQETHAFVDALLGQLLDKGIADKVRT